MARGNKKVRDGRESANAVVGKMSERGYDLLVQIQLAMVPEEPKPLSLPPSSNCVCVLRRGQSTHKKVDPL